VNPNAVNYTFRVDTSASPDGANPITVPGKQFFNKLNKLSPPATIGVGCCPMIFFV